MSNLVHYNTGFNFIRFIKFIEYHNIASVAIAAVLSERIGHLTNEFVDNIILPVMNIDLNNDGVKDFKFIEDMTIKIGPVKFIIGKFLISFIKFVIVMYILFVISKMLQRVTKKL